MEFGELTAIWRRRRLLTAGLVVLAALGLLAAKAALPPTDQSQASVVLLASPAASKANGGNPYLSFTPSLSLTADAVSRDLMAPVTASHLAASGFADQYTVALPTLATPATGSVLIITVTGHDPASVQRTLLAVIRQVGVALGQIQGLVRPKDRIGVATLARSPRAALAVGKTARPLVAIGLLGLLVALGLPVLADPRLARRAARRATAAQGRADEEVGVAVGGWGSLGTGRGPA